MWVNLFYDKYAGDEKGNGDHHYNNQLTSKVTIDELEDGSFNYYCDKDALELYNKMFNGQFSLPECAYKIDLYKLKIYTKKIQNMETIYVVISVNVQLLEELITSKLQIPNIDFLKLTCRYHLAYTETAKFFNNSFFYNNNTENQKIEKNINYIVEKALEPVDYTFHNKVSKMNEINVDLFEYQKCSVYWMKEKENNKKNILYNLNEEVILGNIYYDITTQQIDLISNKKKLEFYGGGIIDEVGLGKTLQVIGLTIVNPPKQISYVNNKINNKFCSKATLVFCQNQLCGQWKREMKDKISKEYDANIITVLTKRDFDKLTYQDLLNADIVLVSFTFLGNESFTSQWSSDISSVKSFAKKQWLSADISMVRDHFSKLGNKLLEDPINSLYKTQPLFQLIHWHRFVIDEFHEILKGTTYKYIYNLLPFITAENKWIVTATLFNEKEHLSDAVEFLTNYHNVDGKRIFTNEKIIDYLSANCFRRNTKDSVKKEHTIPPINEEIRWLKFSPTERMMYNAYLANQNNNKFSVYLRQLCCHPQLAEETKEALSNCKTLEDIEKMMVKHYQLQVDGSQEKVNNIQERIDKLNKKIKKLEKKQKKKLLKKNNTKEEDNDSSDSDENNESDDDILNDEFMMILTGSNIQPTMTIQNLKENVEKLETKKKEAINELDGKKATCSFFNNVVERIRKTVSKESKTGDKNKNLENVNILDAFNADTDEESSQEDGNEDNCGICLGEIPEDGVGVTKCGHIFCYECLQMTVSKSHKCPYCNNKLNNDQIYVLSYEKKKKSEEMTQTQKTKEQLINDYGTKLANIITYIKESNQHTIVFSQWDDLLRRIGHILKFNNIPNVFCRGNCYQRDKAIREFNEDDKIKVIMLSSDSSAAGTNLTKATQVILIDPIYGNYQYRKDQERQAIGRAHRLGQKSNIKVIRFIIKESVEEEIYKMNVDEDKKNNNIPVNITEINVN
ncbi:DEAD/SNF2-like helicase [Indivirus ILV1]|uniref:DEAD/SNF2-like helicase n=1 Tax=Indivirus ILV1 TaxID=1977633 RepID=A0A1V0SCM1_9VIRU|nr:DEAD/SNF2-like helicase [Indivirus ILV1]